MRGRRVLRAAVIGAALWLLARTLVAGGSGGDTTGSYELLQPGYSYPCAPIHYVISSPEAPPDFVQVVHGAIGKISVASGYRFFFDGMTKDRSFNSHLVGPVLIGFGSTGENSDFADGAIGVGGSAYNESDGRFTSGVVMLDATKYTHLDNLEDRQAIVMHELGHVLGLDHVDDPHELMNPEYVGQRKLGPGDLAGLHQLHETSCPAS